MKGLLINAGGTSERVGESFLWANALGLFTKPLDMMIGIDQEGPYNGNFLKTKNLYDNLVVLRRTGLLNADLELYEHNGDYIYAPADTTHNTFISYLDPQGDKEIAVIDMHFSKESQNIPLKDGYRARNDVGHTVMVELEKAFAKDGFFEKLNNYISTSLNEGPVYIMICNSSFGASGSSAGPMIAKILKNKYGDQIRLGMLVLMPYFSFPDAEAEGIYASAKDFGFLTNSFIGDLVDNNYADSTYLIGDSSYVQIENFALSGVQQKNPPNPIELLSVTAWEHFTTSELTGQFYLNRNKENVSWQDFRLLNDFKRKITTFTTYCYDNIWNYEAIFGSANEKENTQRFRATCNELKWYTNFKDVDLTQHREILTEGYNLSKKWIEYLKDLHVYSSLPVDLLNMDDKNRRISDIIQFLIRNEKPTRLYANSLIELLEIKNNAKVEKGLEPITRFFQLQYATAARFCERTWDLNNNGHIEDTMAKRALPLLIDDSRISTGAIGIWTQNDRLMTLLKDNIQQDIFHYEKGRFPTVGGFWSIYLLYERFFLSEKTNIFQNGLALKLSNNWLSYLALCCFCEDLKQRSINFEMKTEEFYFGNGETRTSNAMKVLKPASLQGNKITIHYLNNCPIAIDHPLIGFYFPPELSPGLCGVIPWVYRNELGKAIVADVRQYFKNIGGDYSIRFQEYLENLIIDESLPFKQILEKNLQLRKKFETIIHN